MGTARNWPVAEGTFEAVIMSYLSGSVPANAISGLYANAHTALSFGGRLIVHDFMVDDSLDGPPLAALWALQHVTVNPEGLGLCPGTVASKIRDSGFSQTET